MRKILNKFSCIEQTNQLTVIGVRLIKVRKIFFKVAIQLGEEANGCFHSQLVAHLLEFFFDFLRGDLLIECTSLCEVPTSFSSYTMISISPIEYCVTSFCGIILFKCLPFPGLLWETNGHYPGRFLCDHFYSACSSNKYSR